MKKLSRWLLDGYALLLCVFVIAFLFTSVNPGSPFTSLGIEGVQFKIVFAILLLTVVMFGMIIGMKITRWRDRKATQAAFEEFGKDIIDDMVNLFLNEIPKELQQYYAELDSQQLKKIKETISNEFDDLQQIIENNSLFPWQNSKPNKMQRDKIIWEMRNDDRAWKEIARAAKCSISTAKDSYNRMLILARQSGKEL